MSRAGPSGELFGGSFLAKASEHFGVLRPPSQGRLPGIRPESRRLGEDVERVAPAPHPRRCPS